MPPPIDTSGPLKLRPTTSPFGALGAILFVALFWNGIVSVFIWQDVVNWGKQGGPGWFLALFLVPFVLIGLTLIYALVRQVLLLFNPRSHLTLTPGTLAPGGAAYLQWQLGSGGGGVRRVVITCEATRKTPSPSGRGNQVPAQPFFSQPVVDTSQPAEIASGGAASFALPADAPPSTDGLQPIVWALRVRTEIRFWPDGDDEFPVRVLPAGNG